MTKVSPIDLNASALAVAIARQLGANLADYAGSGSGGRRIKSDLVPAADANACPGRLLQDSVPRRALEDEGEIPFSLSVDMQSGALLKLRDDLNGALAARKVVLSIPDLLTRALALAVRQVPTCNVSSMPSGPVPRARLDISLTTSTASGLTKTLVENATDLSLSAIASRRAANESVVTDTDVVGLHYVSGSGISFSSRARTSTLALVVRIGGKMGDRSSMDDAERTRPFLTRPAVSMRA